MCTIQTEMFYKSFLTISVQQRLQTNLRPVPPHGISKQIQEAQHIIGALEYVHFT